MNSFAVLLLSVAVVVAVVCAQEVPDLPTQFTAKVTFTIPFIGATPGVMYYDYINGKSRYDMQSSMGDSITIYRYDIENPTEYVVTGGNCEANDIDGEMNPMAIPPFASYEGQENIDSVICDHWSFNMLDFGTLDWFVVNSTDDDGKITFELVRFSETMTNFQIDFSATTPGPVDPSLFEVNGYGCPPPPPPVTYSISGYVKSANTNKIIAGATVTLGSNSVTSDSNGKYEFSSLDLGNYSISATASGFYGSTIMVSMPTDSIPAGTLADFILSPALAAGQYRIVLTWGSAPRDLDSWLRVPDGYQVSFNKPNYYNCSLDVDQTQGFGPETITIHSVQGSNQPFPYYYFYVLNYSGEKSLLASDGRIQLYGQNGLIADLHVPTTGVAEWRTWKGFQLYTNGTLVILNQIAFIY